MKWYEIFLLLIIFLTSAHIAYQIFKMTEADAKSRGFKKPKLWGVLTAGGQNGGGLILYLLGRRKYSSAMSENEKRIMESRKNKIAVDLIALVLAAIGLIIVIFLK